MSFWAARNLGGLLIVALFLLLLPLSTPRIYATDEVQYFAYIRSLYFDGDLDFRNEYQHFAEIGLSNGDPAVFDALLRDHPTDPPLIPATGLYRNVAPIGAALLWSPGFVLADLLVRVANLLGAHIPATGYSWPYITAVCSMSALYSLLGLLLTYRLARRYSSEFAATLATIAVWLATPLVFYTYILMPWSHAPGFFLFALFLTLWLRGVGDRLPGEEGKPIISSLAERGARRSLGMWAWLGLVGGLMTITREQLGLLLIMPAVEGLVAYSAIARTKNKEQRTKGSESRTEGTKNGHPQGQPRSRHSGNSKPSKLKTRNYLLTRSAVRWSVVGGRWSCAGTPFSADICAGAGPAAAGLPDAVWPPAALVDGVGQARTQQPALLWHAARPGARRVYVEPDPGDRRAGPALAVAARPAAGGAAAAGLPGPDLYQRRVLDLASLALLRVPPADRQHADLRAGPGGAAGLARSRASAAGRCWPPRCCWSAGTSG